MVTSGRTKGTRYFVPPEILQRLDFAGRTTLTRIEPHRLDALVIEDVSRYPDSSIAKIHARIGSEIPRVRLKRCLAGLVEVGRLTLTGAGRTWHYRLTPPSAVPEP